MIETESTISQPVVCKYCQSQNTRKYGLVKGTQTYFCNTCHRKFRANDHLFKMKTPADVVSKAVSAYYEGMSLRAICRHLQQEGIEDYPTNKTVFDWVNRYTDEAIRATTDYHPKVGDTWICDETYVRVDLKKRNAPDVENPYSRSKKAKWVIFWDCIDADTRYLLASHVTTTRGTKDAQALLEKAAARAGKAPKTVVTDSLSSYLDGVELAYGADAAHRQGGPFNIENNTNLIERFHGTLKARTKVMRALRNKESCQKFTDGWLVHYNYLRPHESLEGKTPAEAAGLDYPFKSWADVTRRASPDVKVLVTAAKVSLINTDRPPRPRVAYKPAPRKPRMSKPKPTTGLFTSKDGGMVSRRHFRGARRIR